MTGYVEATRSTDEEKNAACVPTPYSDTPEDWITSQILGGDASQALSRNPDVKAWSNETTLNPARVAPELRDDPEVLAAAARLKATIGAGRARLADLAQAFA